MGSLLTSNDLQQVETYLPSQEECARLVNGIGALIRAERQARGFSCRHLARRAALSHDHVRRIELGHRRPGRTALRAIAYG
jgi:ribosome-binding protein aMBF1 (putative translation factor)